MDSDDLNVILPDLVYDCLRCGKGCSVDFTVLVSPEVEERIIDTETVAEVRRAGYLPLKVLDDGRKSVGRRENRECVYLRDDRLCALHFEHGVESKPRPCRQFPFHPINTPDGFYVGLSFFCTAVQQRHGRELGEQTDEIKQAISQQFSEVPPVSLVDIKIQIGPGLEIEWETYKELEALIAGDLDESALLSTLWSVTARTGNAFLHHLYGETPFLAETVKSAPAPPLELASEALESVVSNLVAVIEASGDQRQQLSERYLQGHSFSSRDGTLLLSARPGYDLPEWFDAEVYRYFQHTIFRKFLAHGPVLGHLFVLCALHRVLRFYTFAHADNAQRQSPTIDDYYRALDTVELELMLHADGLAPLYEHLQYIVLSVLDPG